MPRERNIIDGSVVMAFVLIMGAATLRPSATLMASEGSAGAAGKPTQQASLKPAAATAPDIPFTDYRFEDERVLLGLANQARAEVGAPSLALDAGLCRAARAHAEAMLAARQLSHQFVGEPSLPQRLASATRTQLDQEGENVALDFDAESGHKHLMLSPPHRANLLNPAYNVIGLAVVRSGSQMYIVQDFGHALPNLSTAEVKDRIAAAVLQARHQANQPDLARRDLSTADDAACSMAQADKLGTSPIHQLAQRYTVLTYTSLHPAALPANASHALSSSNQRTFSVGVCYSRTETYPMGVYWVVVALN
jgi:uncharacterized protein YkwD